MNAHKFPTFHLGATALLSIAMMACTQVTTPIGTPVTSLSDSGPGSLRELLAAAQPGDTLQFRTAGTVKLAGPLSLSKNVTLLADGVTFDAGGSGRALEVASGATVILKGGTLTNGKGQVLTSTSLERQASSKATWGGLMLNRGTLTLDGMTLTGGTANNGGAIYNSGTLTLKGVTMTGNTATIPTPDLEDESTGSGGAIANTGILTIESGTFTGNTAYYTGGVLRSTDGGSTALLTIKDGLFENNSCTAPNMATSGPTGSDGCAGGAFLLGNTTSIEGGTFRGNTSTYVGGAVYISNGLKPVVKISGGTFENNRTTGSVNNGGGAILSQSKLLISGGTFKGNGSMNGGAINLSSGGSLTLSDGTFEGNNATRYGGALQINSTAALFEMTGGRLRGNTSGLSGGAINSDIPMSLTGGVVENNTAGERGGGLNLYASGGKKTSVTLGGTLLIRGNAAVKAGGGVNADSADMGGQTLNITGGEISGNTVTGTQPGNGGGGLAVQARAVLNLSGGKVKGNSAAVTGGGLVLGGAATMTGGEVSGNTVSGSAGAEGGGGVRLYAGAKMTASGGSISSNTAPFGGGIKTDGSYQTSATSEFALAGATVSGNSTTDNVGGGFFNDGKLMITSGSVTNNTAKTNGGGIFNSKNALYSQTGGSVTGNLPDNVLQGQ